MLYITQSLVEHFMFYMVEAYDVCRQMQRSSIAAGTPNPVFVADLLEYVFAVVFRK